MSSDVLYIQVLILAVMLVEVVVVIARRESHLRVTRALRPIFFVDNVLMESVRRYCAYHVHVIISIPNHIILISTESYVTFKNL